MKRRTLFATLFLSATAWLTAAMPAGACAEPEPTYNYYIFRVTPAADINTYSRAIDDELAAEWSRYAHCEVTRRDMQQLSELSLENFDTMQNPVLNYARSVKDSDMLEYLRFLARYLDLTRDGSDGDVWDYESEAELDNEMGGYTELLKEVRRVRSGRLKARYRLLEMRILFHMDDYTACCNVWENTGIDYPQNVFDRMACGLYAGSLFRQNRRSEAAGIYARLGDTRSARMCLNSISGMDCLRATVGVDPNAEALPVMIEDFISSIQETHDWLRFNDYEGSGEVARIDGGILGRSFYDYLTLPNSYARYTDDFRQYAMLDRLMSERARDHFGNLSVYGVFNRDIDDFLKLSETVLQLPQLKDAALWASARAYIYYMCGDLDNAWAAIRDVRSMTASTQTVADNARIIRLLIATTFVDDARMEQEIGGDLKWLVERYRTTFAAAREAERKYFKKYESDDNAVYGDDDDADYEAYNVASSESGVLKTILTRLLVHGFGSHYDNVHNLNLEQLCYYLTNDLEAQYYENGPFCFYQLGDGGVFFTTFSSLSYAEQCAFYRFLFEPSGESTPLQQYLRSLVEPVRADFQDFIGTRCINDGQWEEAQKWLEPLSLDYLSHQHIAPYTLLRNYTTEMWFKHVADKTEELQGSRVTRNVKLDFCRDVLRARRELTKLTGEARYKKAYELATMLFQASFRGDCWWLTRYINFSEFMYEESPMRPEPLTAFDYIGEANKLLGEALATKDSQLKSRVLMARFFLAGRVPVKSADFDRDGNHYAGIDRKAPSWKAFLELNDFMSKHSDVDARISHCDVVAHCRQPLRSKK